MRLRKMKSRRSGGMKCTTSYVKTVGHDGLRGNDLKCGFKSHDAINAYCTKNPRCKGYSWYSRRGWWCAKYRSPVGPKDRTHNWYQKVKKCKMTKALSVNRTLYKGKSGRMLKKAKKLMKATKKDLKMVKKAASPKVVKKVAAPKCAGKCGAAGGKDPYRSADRCPHEAEVSK